MYGFFSPVFAIWEAVLQGIGTLFHLAMSALSALCSFGVRLLFRPAGLLADRLGLSDGWPGLCLLLIATTCLLALLLAAFAAGRRYHDWKHHR